MNEAATATVVVVAVVVVVAACSIRRKHSIILNSIVHGFVVAAVALFVCLHFTPAVSVSVSAQSQHLAWQIRPTVPSPVPGPRPLCGSPRLFSLPLLLLSLCICCLPSLSLSLRLSVCAKSVVRGLNEYQPGRLLYSQIIFD